MSRRVFIILFVLLFILSPLSLSWPTKKITNAETSLDCQEITVDTTWTLAGSPYIINCDITIAKDATLTIEPGVVVKLAVYTSIIVEGKLVAAGNSGEPIVFTYKNDNEHGGYYCPLYGCDPYDYGNWGTIVAEPGGEIDFDNVSMFYAGESYSVAFKNKINDPSKLITLNSAQALIMIPSEVGAVYNRGGLVKLSNSVFKSNVIGIKTTAGTTTVDNVEISNNNIGISVKGGNITVSQAKIVNNDWIGVDVSGGSVAINSSILFGNYGGAIVNGSDNQVDATNNWWGDDSGPYNIDYNVYGLGNEVSGDVLFFPWTKINTAPKRNPVIIVPGILGSYLDNQNSDEVWPNFLKMGFSADDSYLNELALPLDGIPTGSSTMVPHDIFRSILNQDFFNGIIAELKNNGYKDDGQDQDLFVFPYDWRLDIDYLAGYGAADNPNTLANKIQAVLNQTNTEKVDIVAHSMGGLIVKKYLETFGTSSVNSFIDIATPHLGAPQAFKALMFGDNFDIWPLNLNTVKGISQNMPSIFQLVPSKNYFDSNDANYRAYLADIYDYDNNGVIGNLNYDQSIEFMKNTGRNNSLLQYNESLHNAIDDYSPQSAGIKTNNIVGCSKPTVGKIYVLNKEKSGGWEYGLQYISGDGTVPLRSAEHLVADKTYYNSGVEHAYLPSTNGVKQLVVSILKGNQDNFDLSAYPNLSASNNICSFSGMQIEYHSPIELHIYDSDGNHLGPDANGDIEMGIAGARYDIIDNNKFAFLPAGDNYKVVGRATESGTFNADVRTIIDGVYARTAYFNELPLTSSSTNVRMDIADNQTNYIMQIDQNNDGVFEEEREPSSILNEQESQDMDKPETSINVTGALGNNDWYNSDVNIELTSIDNDNGSGILKTEYSLDNGANWNNYEAPLTISQEGTTTIFYQATDRAGNVEITKTRIFKIDKTKPTIDIIIPYAGQEFHSSNTLEIVYEASDNLSGIASASFSIDGNALASTTAPLSGLNIGRHTLRLEAEDLAGNKNSATVFFNIVKDNITIDSTISDINRLYSAKEIYREIVKTTLIKELQIIKSLEGKYGVRREKINETYEKAMADCIEYKEQEWCQQNLEKYRTFYYYFNTIYTNIIKLEYQVALKTLDFYNRLNWLSKNAYDIIKNDISWLINN